MGLHVDTTAVQWHFTVVYSVILDKLILKFLYVADVQKMITHALPQYIRQEQTDHHSQGTVSSSHDIRLRRVDRVTS